MGGAVTPVTNLGTMSPRSTTGVLYTHVPVIRVWSPLGPVSCRTRETVTLSVLCSYFPFVPVHCLTSLRDPRISCLTLVSLCPQGLGHLTLLPGRFPPSVPSSPSSDPIRLGDSSRLGRFNDRGGDPVGTQGPVPALLCHGTDRLLCLSTRTDSHTVPVSFVASDTRTPSRQPPYLGPHSYRSRPRLPPDVVLPGSPLVPVRPRTLPSTRDT